MPLPFKRRDQRTRAQRGIDNVGIRMFRRGEREEYRVGEFFPGMKSSNLSLEGYDRRLQASLMRDIATIVHRRGKVRVLDVGAGEGIAAIQLQKKWGRDKVELHAIGLTRPFDTKSKKIFGKKLQAECTDPWNAFTSYRVGDVSRIMKKMKRRFDLIVSANAGTTPEKVPAIIDSLDSGGVAHIQLLLPEPIDFRQIINTTTFTLHQERPIREDKLGHTLCSVVIHVTRVRGPN